MLSYQLIVGKFTTAHINSRYCRKLVYQPNVKLHKEKHILSLNIGAKTKTTENDLVWLTASLA